MKLLVTQLIVIGTFCDLISCSGYFTIVGSKLLRKNAKYSVAITSRNFDDSDIPTLEVAIQNFNGNWKRAQNITLINGKIQSLELDLTGQPLDDYMLKVKSITGQNCSGVAELNMNTKNVSAFVQTDKAIYKPNDAVQFRVLVLNENLKPLDEKCQIQIHITDGAENRVKQFDDIILLKGVFQSEFKLTDSPVLGDWYIHVFVDNKNETRKRFEVAEYTLPYLEVRLDVNPHTNYDERKIRATLVTKYTFGEIAKGNATVTAEVLGLIVPKTIEVKNEKTFVEFDIKNELKVRHKNKERTVTLFASFTEVLTGRVQNTTAKVELHFTPHKIEMIDKSKKLKPGLPFTVRAIVLQHDKNAPVTDSHNPVMFTLKFFSTPKDEMSENNCYGIVADELISMPSYDKVLEEFLSNGISEIQIQIPENVTKLKVSAKYLETEKTTVHSVTQSENNEYIKITSRTEKPKLRENIQLNVQSTKALREISYHVFSTKGDVVASDTIETLSAKSKDFEFSTTHDMVPKAKIVVFYITSNGEIISDSLELEVENELRNFIDIRIPKSKNRVSPSELIDISITSNPNSYIGLLGLDQSVLLLKGGNDIEWSAVIGDLKQYNEVNRKFSEYIENYDDKSYLDFDSSEIVIITNAKREYSLRGSPRMGGSDTHTSSVGDESVRKIFPETWLFDSLNFEFNQTSATISKKVPDTITSWIITGFSINPITGLGLTKKPTKLNVFQPFFVLTKLPYSIKRGEIVSIPIDVFNYMENNQTVDVTLYNEDSEFSFIADTASDVKLRQEVAITKNIDVNSQSKNSTLFIIRPLKIGLLKIKVVANSSIAGDRVERYLNVEPEGVTRSKNKTIFIDLTNDEKFETEINIDIPPDVVPDSIRIETSVTGDILGTSIENLVKSRKLPSDSAERTLLKFVHNIVVLDYFTAVNKLTAKIEEEAKASLETGYLKELTYKHDDGSYNRLDMPGSTWLTASVAKSFHQAAKYISIDREIIKKALHFLNQTQSDEGCFVEVSNTFQKDIPCGSSGIALTAYTLTTFLENTDLIETYKITIDKALAFINENYESVTDNYSLAIMAYALHLAEDSLKKVILSKLETRAISEDEMIYWRKKSSASDENSSYKASSLDIKTTAYALQAYLEAGRLTDSIKIMKWLVSQWNGNGGFDSTEDALVGLQALSKMATKMYTLNNNIDITVKHSIDESLIFQVNERNSLILQKAELPSTARHFGITAEGHGFSIFQLSYKYNLNTSSNESERFYINPTVNPISSQNFLKLTVCVNFIPDEVTAKSNRAVMKVNFPSGFVFDFTCKPQLNSTNKVKKVEIAESETAVEVYIDDLSITSVCTEFIAFRLHRVASQKSASVEVCDDTNRALRFYNLPHKDDDDYD